MQVYGLSSIHFTRNLVLIKALSMLLKYPLRKVFPCLRLEQQVTQLYA